MRNNTSHYVNRRSRPVRYSLGFSMVELLVALAVFMVVGGAAMSVFKSHVTLFSTQQNQSTLNFTLRNAAAQLQIDVVNAGNGFYTGADIAAWPVGVTVKNNYTANTSCYDSTTHTYGPNCFDELNVIATDLAVPLAHPADNGANCVSTTASSLFATPLTGTLANLASFYHQGDQILLISSDGQQMSTAVLTKDAQVTGGKVKLEHNPTGAGGQNTADNDQLGISSAANNKLGEQFCTDDWVVKLAPIKYKVDASNPANPKLVRVLTASNTQEVIAEQIIGFKVAASVKNADADIRYDAPADPPLGYDSDWTQIKAVRFTIIGRTGTLAGSSYRNGFDNGPYRVEAISFVVNPRNLSMND